MTTKQQVNPFVTTLEPFPPEADPNCRRKEIYRSHNESVAIGLAKREVVVCSCQCVLCVNKRKLESHWPIRIIVRAYRDYKFRSKQARVMKDIRESEARAAKLMQEWRDGGDE